MFTKLDERTKKRRISLYQGPFFSPTKATQSRTFSIWSLFLLKGTQGPLHPDRTLLSRQRQLASSFQPMNSFIQTTLVSKSLFRGKRIESCLPLHTQYMFPQLKAHKHIFPAAPQPLTPTRRTRAATRRRRRSGTELLSTRTLREPGGLGTKHLRLEAEELEDPARHARVGRRGSKPLFGGAAQLQQFRGCVWVAVWFSCENLFQQLKIDLPDILCSGVNQ